VVRVSAALSVEPAAFGVRTLESIQRTAPVLQREKHLSVQIKERI